VNPSNCDCPASWVANASVRFNPDLTTVTFSASWYANQGAYSTGLAVTDDGSMIVVGSFSGETLTIGGSTLDVAVYGSSSKYQNYVAKFDSAGDLAYVKVRVIHARVWVDR